MSPSYAAPLTAARRVTLASIRKRLNIARAVRGDTLADVAKSFGVTRPYLSAVLHGKRISASMHEQVERYISKALDAMPGAPDAS